MTLQTFHFEGAPVRDVLDNGEPWFVGKDVCGVLGISNHNDALATLPEDERRGVAITDPLGRNSQEMICVNEPGLYRLIFKSRKAAAERFKRWVLHEVLPEIRRTGHYGEAREPQGEFTVPVGDYIALLQWKIGVLEEKAKPKPKKAAGRPVTDDEIIRMRELAASGMKYSQIARELGRGEGSVSMLLRVCPPKDKWASEQKAPASEPQEVLEGGAA